MFIQSAQLFTEVCQCFPLDINVFTQTCCHPCMSMGSYSVCESTHPSMHVHIHVLVQAFLQSGLGDKVNIVCTEPRRVSAVSLAMRVAEELGDTGPGERDSFCGYQIRFESKKCETTRLMYCTTGVLLRRLQHDPLLKDISHIIVDEVGTRLEQVVQWLAQSPSCTVSVQLAQSPSCTVSVQLAQSPICTVSVQLAQSPSCTSLSSTSTVT